MGRDCRFQDEVEEREGGKVLEGDVVEGRKFEDEVEGGRREDVEGDMEGDVWVPG